MRGLHTKNCSYVLVCGGRWGPGSGERDVYWSPIHRGVGPHSIPRPHHKQFIHSFYSDTNSFQTKCFCVPIPKPVSCFFSFKRFFTKKPMKCPSNGQALWPDWSRACAPGARSELLEFGLWWFLAASFFFGMVRFISAEMNLVNNNE